MERETLSSSVGLEETRDYSEMPLLTLAARIALNGDGHALRELHDNRSPFPGRHGQMLRLVDFVMAIAQSPLARRWCGYDQMVVDHAYDLTVDKFANIPPRTGGHRESRRHGPDCRYYFKAFFDCAVTRLRDEPPATTIEAEMTTARLLQRFVERHFHLSCWESRRRARKLVRRYAWELDGYTLYVWLPLTMPGGRCRQWLETHIPAVDPSRVGEQDRVQEIVDRLLATQEIVPIHRVSGGLDNIPGDTGYAPTLLEEQVTVDGLARVVAEEKAENITHQRPAIRQLGAGKLQELVHTIFAHLASEDYVEQAIARRFGVSTSTLSRFAGSRWNDHPDDGVPDLWHNTAHTLAGHPTFVMAARAAGIWKRVAQISEEGTRERRSTDG